MKFLSVALLPIALMIFSLAGCESDGGSSSPTSAPTFSVNADTFISALNSMSASANSKVTKYSSFQTDYFIFFDSEINQYVAINRSLIRAAAGWEKATADTLNAVALDYRLAANKGIPAYGMDIVYFDGTNYAGTAQFRSSTTNVLYEEESRTKDVELMNANSEAEKLFAKASAISVHFQMNIESSIKIALLGDKVEKLTQEHSGELTATDKAALTSEAMGLAGISMEDLSKAVIDPTNATADELLMKAASTFGTTPANLRDRILPELTGMKF